LDDDCVFDGVMCWGEAGFALGTLTWNDMTLQRDIVDATYTFAMAASSYGSTKFMVEVILLQQQSPVILASTTFTATSPEARQYVSTVEGIDPAVNRGVDQLEVMVFYVSGNVGLIYFGAPERAGAGGSYIEVQFEY
jgi:hypothetical protein